MQENNKNIITMTPYIVAPLVGSVIGYITNDIAIRMLFRPHKARYVLGYKVPFTPGIIPKEKGRIAASVGASISVNLMNREVLEKNLLSDEMLEKLDNALRRFCNTLRHSPLSLREWLSQYLPASDIEDIADKTCDDLTSLLHKKLGSQEVGDKIAHMAVKHVMKKMQHFGSGIGDKLAEGGIGEGGGFGDMIGRGIRKILGRTGSDATSKFINSLAEPVEQALSANINDMLQNHSEEIVGQLLHTEMDDFLSRPMNKLLKGKDAEIERFVSSVLSLYKSTIKERLPRILEAVDIRKIVEDRINEMDMSEAEKIILDVISKELRAIVWLGAGLGFIMGFVNCLII